MKTKIAILILSIALGAFALSGQFKPGQFPDALGQTPPTKDEQTEEALAAERLSQFPTDLALKSAIQRIGQLDKAIQMRDRAGNVDNLMVFAYQDLAIAQKVVSDRRGPLTDQQAEEAREAISHCMAHMEAAIAGASKP